MSSALEAVVAQIQLDRKRFRDLVNGDETATVDLEGRTEKSIANTVKTRLDNLTSDLSTAVSDAEQAASSASLSRTNADQSAADANTALSGATTARNDAEGFSTSAQQASTDAESYKTETEGYRDQVVSDKNTVSALASQVTTDANAVASDKATTSSLKDDVIALKDEIMVTPMTISYSIDPTEAKVHRIDRENSPTITISNNPPAGRFSEVLVFLEGTSGSVTWPTAINWDDGVEPSLGTNWTVVSLRFFADVVIGKTESKG